MWIKNNGTAPEPGTEVEVKIRGFNVDTRMARDVDWTHKKTVGDVTSYTHKGVTHSWSGGECPCEDDTAFVEVHFRQPGTERGRTEQFSWVKKGTYTDIVAYQVVKGALAVTPRPQIETYAYTLPETKVSEKQERYKDATGDDWIDECARTLTREEFHGAMKFTIGKYVRRLGKKDALEKELIKIADYANRWMDYENNR